MIDEKNIHICSKEEVLDRMSVILLGNGHPEDGLAFRFREFMKDHERVVSDISEIKNKIDIAITSASHTAKALAEYQAEMKGFDNGQDSIEKRQAIADDLKARNKRDTRMVIFNIVALCLTFFGVLTAVYFGFTTNKNTHDIKTEQANENSITRGGQHYDPFANDTIK